MALKPCPYCGSSVSSLGERECPETYATYVFCGVCGAEGPSAFDEEDPQALWNRRAAGATERDLAAQLLADMPRIVVEHGAALINQDLLAACQAADAYLHAQPGPRTPAAAALCDQLVRAIGGAIRPAAQPTED